MGYRASGHRVAYADPGVKESPAPTPLIISRVPLLATITLEVGVLVVDVEVPVEAVKMILDELVPLELQIGDSLDLGVGRGVAESITLEVGDDG